MNMLKFVARPTSASRQAHALKSMPDITELKWKPRTGRPDILHIFMKCVMIRRRHRRVMVAWRGGHQH
jgi:hypothetical protein